MCEKVADEMFTTTQRSASLRLGARPRTAPARSLIDTRNTFDGGQKYRLATGSSSDARWLTNHVGSLSSRSTSSTLETPLSSAATAAAAAAAAGGARSDYS